MDNKKINEAIRKAVDREEFYGALVGWDGTNNARCPFPDKHSGGNDSTPSLSVFQDTGGCFCHGCGWKSTAPAYAYADVKGIEFESALRILYSRYVEPLVPFKEWKTAHKELLKTGVVLEKLLTTRGINIETVRRFNLGYSKSRLTIPVFNDLGLCVNLRRYDLYKTGGPKMLSWGKGFGGGRLMPLSSLQEEEVILVEGELDALLGCQHGFNCLSSTMGASGWKEEWGPLFTGKSVYILPDNDAPGEAGAAAWKKEISKYSKYCEIIRLPDLKTTGEDLTDWFLKRGGTAERLRGLLKTPPGQQERALGVDSRAVESRPASLSSVVRQEPLSKEEELVQRAAEAWDALSKQGSFFRSETGELFYVHSGSGVCRVTKEPGAFMHRLTRINPIYNQATPVGRYVFEYIRNEAAIADTLSKTGSWSAYYKGSVYVHSGGEDITKCTEAGFETVKNAVNPDGVLLNLPVKGMEVKRSMAMPSNGLDALKQLFLKNLAVPEEDKYLLLAWIMGSFFRDLVRPKPVIRLIARTAYGKSTASKLVSLLVYGQEMLNASASTTAAFYEMGAAYPMVIMDNLETRNMTPALEDFLLIAATGGMKSKRLLSADTGMVQYQSNCLVLTNGIEPFSKHELIDRTVELQLDLAKYGNDEFHETRTFDALRAARPEIMAALLFLVQKYMLPRINKGEIGRIASSLGTHGKERFNEYFAVMAMALDALWGYMPLEGYSSPRTVVERWLGSQTKALGEQSEGTDEVLYYLDTLVDRRDQMMLAGCRVPIKIEKTHTEAKCTARELLSDFRVLAKSLGIKCPWTSERHLGVRLVDSAGVLARSGWKMDGYVSSGRKKYRFTRETTKK